MGAVLGPALFILHSASWALSWELGPLQAVIGNLKTYWGRSPGECVDLGVGLSSLVWTNCQGCSASLLPLKPKSNANCKYLSKVIKPEELKCKNHTRIYRHRTSQNCYQSPTAGDWSPSLFLTSKTAASKIHSLCDSIPNTRPLKTHCQ